MKRKDQVGQREKEEEENGERGSKSCDVAPTAEFTRKRKVADSFHS